uniref:C2H2-type domain-containing protein n=1 Tax=Parascaris univalens TaxID=6257 RepID=A0A915BML9_PARUN
VLEMLEDSDEPLTKQSLPNYQAISLPDLPSTSIEHRQPYKRKRDSQSGGNIGVVRPLILRGRKRAYEMLTMEPSICSANAFMSARLDEFVEVRQRLLEERARIESEGDAYVRQLVDKMGGRFDSLVATRKVTASQQSDSSVRKRLSTRKDCDLRTLSCFVPLCGRSFDSLQVLAWHMSYAHQDVSSSNPRNTICYLCGYTMSTAKGKNAHLTTKHRSIAERHNMECIEQRGSIIAPGAPAAERLRIKQIQLKAHNEQNISEERRSGSVMRSMETSVVDDYSSRLLDDSDKRSLLENCRTHFVEIPIDPAAEEFL